MGKYSFTPPKFDANGNPKSDQFIQWNYELGARDATMNTEALTWLQGYKCAIKLSSPDVGEWTGFCFVEKFSLVPNATPGQPSILRGSIKFVEIPEKLLNLSALWLKTLKHNMPEIVVNIAMLQPTLGDPQ